MDAAERKYFLPKVCAMKKTLFLLLLPALIFSCKNPSGQGILRETVTVHPHEEEPLEGGATRVFLAGTIDMGTGEDWQKEAEAILASREEAYIVYNPRQKEWNPERPGEMDFQVNWELEHLEKADVIVMYFLPDSKSPITLLELGLFARSGKLRVICPPAFYRYDNVRITCEKYKVPLVGSLEEALDF